VAEWPAFALLSRFSHAGAQDSRKTAYSYMGGIAMGAVWPLMVDVHWLPVAAGLEWAIPEVASQNVRTSTYRIELTGMGIMEALPVAGSGVFLLPYCCWLFSCRAAVHARLSTTEVKKMHAARGFRGIVAESSSAFDRSP